VKLEDKIHALTILGNFLQQFQPSGFIENPGVKKINSSFTNNVLNLIENIHIHNPWFTPEFVSFAISSIGSSLTEKNIRKWISSYPELETINKNPHNIGVIMAGNIPLVGFHDFISVLISGNKIIAKLSTKDDKLLSAISVILLTIEPRFNKFIYFEENQLKNIDAAIATGSDNTSRYFTYYFGNVPHIIRKNRNSTAILTGEESCSDLENLADDIFLYFGLGCRNVSKIYVPKNYLFPPLLDNFRHYAYLSNHNKYANNYDYHKAIFLIDRSQHFDTGFLLVKEDPSYSSPVGCLHYEFYNNPDELRERIIADTDKLQCVVSNSDLFTRGIAFGSSQKPMLWDYADNVDTLKFLLNLT